MCNDKAAKLEEVTKEWNDARNKYFVHRAKLSEVK